MFHGFIGLCEVSIVRSTNCKLEQIIGERQNHIGRITSLYEKKRSEYISRSGCKHNDSFSQKCNSLHLGQLETTWHSLELGVQESLKTKSVREICSALGKVEAWSIVENNRIHPNHRLCSWVGASNDLIKAIKAECGYKV